MNDYRVAGTFVALVLFVMGFLNRHQAGSSHWPTTTGTVLSCSTQSGRSVGGVATVYRLKVMYEYRVNGALFTGGDRGYPVVKSQSREEVAAQRANWPPGKTVTVFYDPSDPGESVLVPGKQLWMTWLLWTVGALVFTATWSWYVLNRLRRRARAA